MEADSLLAGQETSDHSPQSYGGWQSLSWSRNVKPFTKVLWRLTQKSCDTAVWSLTVARLVNYWLFMEPKHLLPRSEERITWEYSNSSRMSSAHARIHCYFSTCYTTNEKSRLEILVSLSLNTLHMWYCWDNFCHLQLLFRCLWITGHTYYTNIENEINNFR